MTKQGFFLLLLNGRGRPTHSASFQSHLAPFKVSKGGVLDVASRTVFRQGKAHKHKPIFPVIARVGGGTPDWVARGLPTGGQGSKVYVLCAEPKQ